MEIENKYRSDITPEELKQQDEVLRENKLQSAGRKQMEFLMESSFHRDQLGRLKKALGSKCTYLSHLKRSGKRVDGNWISGDFYYMKAIMKNDMGGKDTILYEIEGKPSELQSSDYRSLFDQLNDNAYAS